MDDIRGYVRAADADLPALLDLFMGREYRGAVALVADNRPGVATSATAFFKDVRCP